MTNPFGPGGPQPHRPQSPFLETTQVRPVPGGPPPPPRPGPPPPPSFGPPPHHPSVQQYAPPAFGPPQQHQFYDYGGRGRQSRSAGRSIVQATVLVVVYLVLAFGTSLLVSYVYDVADSGTGEIPNVDAWVGWLWLPAMLWAFVGVIVAADTGVRSRGAAAIAALLGLGLWLCFRSLATLNNLGVVDVSDDVWHVVTRVWGVISVFIVAAWILGHRRNLLVLIIVPFYAGVIYGLDVLIERLDLDSVSNLESAARVVYLFEGPAIVIAVAFCWIAVGIDKIAQPRPPSPQ